MSKYRSENISDQMLRIEQLLNSIAEKDRKSLNVPEILKTDPELSFEEATMLGMQKNSEEAYKQAMALAMAMAFDRIMATVEFMIKEMKDANEADSAKCVNAERYEKRMEILTDFPHILDELNPSLSHKFAQR